MVSHGAWIKLQKARTMADSPARGSSTAVSSGGDCNVLGTPLESCCTELSTGFYRDGYCRTGKQDHGVHTVCAIMTREFLEFSRSRGNDLMTPVPAYRFPGLRPGDSWCLCASRWREAYEAGVAPRVKLAATHKKSLEIIALDALRSHAVDLN